MIHKVKNDVSQTDDELGRSATPSGGDKSKTPTAESPFDPLTLRSINDDAESEDDDSDVELLTVEQYDVESVSVDDAASTTSTSTPKRPRGRPPKRKKKPTKAANAAKDVKEARLAAAAVLKATNKEAAMRKKKKEEEERRRLQFEGVEILEVDSDDISDSDHNVDLLSDVIRLEGLSQMKADVVSHIDPQFLDEGEGVTYTGDLQPTPATSGSVSYLRPPEEHCPIPVILHLGTLSYLLAPIDMKKHTLPIGYEDISILFESPLSPKSTLSRIFEQVRSRSDEFGAPMNPDTELVAFFKEFGSDISETCVHTHEIILEEVYDAFQALSRFKAGHAPKVLSIELSTRKTFVTQLGAIRNIAAGGKFVDDLLSIEDEENGDGVEEVKEVDEVSTGDSISPQATVFEDPVKDDAGGVPVAVKAVMKSAEEPAVETVTDIVQVVEVSTVEMTEVAATKEIKEGHDFLPITESTSEVKETIEKVKLTTSIASIHEDPSTKDSQAVSQSDSPSKSHTERYHLTAASTENPMEAPKESAPETPYVPGDSIVGNADLTKSGGEFPSGLDPELTQLFVKEFAHDDEGSQAEEFASVLGSAKRSNDGQQDLETKRHKDE